MKRRGFTLIELVIALVIFFIIIVITFGIIARYFSVSSANEQEMIIQQNFRVALERITEDFRQASSNPVISSPDDNTVSKLLSFTGSDGKTIEYRLSQTSNSTYVIIRSFNGEPQPVTEEMHQLIDLFFIRSGGRIIVVLVGNVKYFGRESPITFASLVFSRNASYVNSP